MLMGHSTARTAMMVLNAILSSSRAGRSGTRSLHADALSLGVPMLG
jgi:hypothetical protein